METSSIEIIITDGNSDNNQKYWVGGKYNIKLKQIPDKSFEKIYFKFSSKTNVELSNSQLIMKSSGKECLTAYTKRIKSKICFNIYNTPNLNFKEKVLKIETQSIINLDLDMGDYPKSNIKYESNHPEIVKVDTNGTITAIRPGKAIIKASGLDYKGTKIEVFVTSNNGFINNNTLNELNIGEYKNIMIVAHPDDEVIWGGAHLLKEKYFILCLTNGYNLPRANDFRKMLNFTKNIGIILCYPDVQDFIRDNWIEVRNGILKDISIVINYKYWAKIVTHGPDGNYGHYHHKKTCEYVTLITKKFNKFQNLYYFGKFYNKNSIPKNLIRISDHELEYKIKGVDIYKSEKNGIYKQLFFTLPFENWILASKWK